VNNQAGGSIRARVHFAGGCSRIVRPAEARYIRGKKVPLGLTINHGDFLAAPIIYNALERASLKRMLV